MTDTERDLQAKVVYDRMSADELADMARALLGDLENATRDANVRFAGHRMVLIVEELARRARSIEESHERGRTT